MMAMCRWWKKGSNLTSYNTKVWHFIIIYDVCFVHTQWFIGKWGRSRKHSKKNTGEHIRYNIWLLVNVILLDTLCNSIDYSRMYVFKRTSKELFIQLASTPDVLFLLNTRKYLSLSEGGLWLSSLFIYLHHSFIIHRYNSCRYHR